ncbi:MAG: phage tail protein [Cyclobacteriaceae bacterium]
MDAFLCTVMGWAPNFAPRDWSYCQGQLMAISTNSAMFSLLGTIYGGDGRSTFGLPDLRGRTMIGSGYAPGLQPYGLGTRGGQEFVTLSIPEIPAHNHTAALSGASATINIAPYVKDGNADEPSPKGNYHATTRSGMVSLNTYSSTTDGSRMATMNETAALSGSVAVGITGNSSSHENRTPYQVLNYIIAMQGIYPSRN